MKKTSNLSLLLMGAVFCSLIYSCADDVKLSNDSFDATSMSGSRTETEAIIEAQKARDFFVGSGKEASRVSQVSNVVKVPNRQSRNDGDGGLYVVNFDNNEGYAIIAVNKNATPVLAYIEEGNFVHRDSIDNPGMQIFMEEALECSQSTELSHLPQGNPPIPRPNYRMWTSDSTFSQVNPRVAVKWGQRWPTGWLFSNHISGCVTTAYLQALSYLSLPTSAYMQCLVGNPLHVFNWSNMRSCIQCRDNYPSDNEVQSNPYIQDYYSLALLSYELVTRTIRFHGRSSVQFLEDGTSTSLEAVKSAVLSLNSSIQVSTPITGRANPKNSLGNGVIIQGGSGSWTDSSNVAHTVSHVWIVDGYKCITVHDCEWEVNPNIHNIDGSPIIVGLISETYTDFVYNHINWGWNGNCNGYFYHCNNYAPNSSYDYDNESLPNEINLPDFTFINDFKYIRIYLN